MGDKTQLSMLLLSSKTKRRLPLLAGATLAFLAVDERKKTKPLENATTLKKAAAFYLGKNCSVNLMVYF